MALSPEIAINDELVEEVQSSRTYKIDFENSRITNEIIDGIDSIRQFVLLALRTVRFVHPIYTSDTGSEIHTLLSDSEVTIDYKIAELPRLITDALIYDERIESVDNFEIEHIENALHGSFRIVSVEGAIEMEEVFLLGTQGTIV